jgi:transaldolase
MTQAHAKRPLNVKIYCDGADMKSMLEMSKQPNIQGLTTNPSLMKKAGITEYAAFCKEVLAQIKDKPISFEVFADEFPEMKRQALEINNWGKNVYVKIPVMNSKGEATYDLVNELSHKGVKLNVTALLTLDQVSRVATALKGGAPSIISIFCGRIADTGVDPMPMARASVAIAASADPNIEVLWASTREVLNVFQADETGCQIITVPFDILKKMDMVGKNLHQLSLETVQMFKRDADQVGYKL